MGRSPLPRFHQSPGMGKRPAELQVRLKPLVHVCPERRAFPVEPGVLIIDQTDSRSPFEIVTRRYDCRSTLASATNRVDRRRPVLFDCDATPTSDALDRLLHQALRIGKDVIDAQAQRHRAVVACFVAGIGCRIWPRKSRTAWFGRLTRTVQCPRPERHQRPAWTRPIRGHAPRATRVASQVGRQPGVAGTGASPVFIGDGGVLRRMTCSRTLPGLPRRSVPGYGAGGVRRRRPAQPSLGLGSERGSMTRSSRRPMR